MCDANTDTLQTWERGACACFHKNGLGLYVARHYFGRFFFFFVLHD